MKKLLKIIIVLVAVGLVSGATAQTFRVKAGLNLTKMAFNDFIGGTRLNSNFYAGFNVGPTVEFPINDILSIETGLLVSTKGLKASNQKKEAITAVPCYLDIPLNIKNTYSVGKIKVYGNLGVYLGIGIAGKKKFVSDSATYSRDINWGPLLNDDYNQVDFGLNVGGGIEVSAFQIGLSYQLGLLNLETYTGNNYTLKNRNLGISIGYRFAGKRKYHQ